MNKMVMIGAAAVVLAAGGGGAYYFLAGGDSGAEAAEKEVEEPAAVLELSTFLTNLKDPSGKRHARVQVQVAIAPETAVAEIEADPLALIRIRDQVLSLINSKTAAELSTVEEKKAFRGEIAESLSGLITQGQVKEVFFSDFVVK